MHKTFCIPHGGGGPGVGAIGVGKHLAPHLPGHELIPITGESAGKDSAAAAAPYGSAHPAHLLDVLFRGANGQCAHEFIIDLRSFKVRRRRGGRREAPPGLRLPLADHVLARARTLMIEPTESEDKEELDRFCDALIAIRGEIAAVADGAVKLEDSPLHHAPHTMADAMTDDWDRQYSRDTAAFPCPTSS
ncbi:glycine dehydrogenase [Aureococcus anophagefferens]|nr:glycine dehydrogenase [Aureococcus anophagefferens]